MNFTWMPCLRALFSASRATFGIMPARSIGTCSTLGRYAAKAFNAPAYVGPSHKTASPSSKKTLPTRSRPCWAPVVTKTSSWLARVPSEAITSTIMSFIPSSPAVGPYWRAWAESAATLWEISRNASSPKARVSGKPPAREIMPGLERVAIRSRVAALFIPLTRLAYRKSKRSRSTSGICLSLSSVVTIYRRHGFYVVPTFFREYLPELGCELEAARRAPPPPGRERLQALPSGGESLFLRHRPDEVRPFDETILLQSRPEPGHVLRSYHRQEEVADRCREHPRRALHEVELLIRTLTAAGHLFEDGGERVLAGVIFESLLQGQELF